MLVLLEQNLGLIFANREVLISEVGSTTPTRLYTGDGRRIASNGITMADNTGKISVYVQSGREYDARILSANLALADQGDVRLGLVAVSAGTAGSGGAPGTISIEDVVGADREFATEAEKNLWASSHSQLLLPGMYAYVGENNKTWKLTNVSPVTWIDVTPPISESNTGLTIVPASGSTSSVFAGMIGPILQFRGLKGKGGISITEFSDRVELDVAATGVTSSAASLDQFRIFDSFNRGGDAVTPVTFNAALEKGGSWVYQTPFNGAIPGGRVASDYLRIEEDEFVITSLNDTGTLFTSETAPGNAWECEYILRGLQAYDLTQATAAGQGGAIYTADSAREFNVYFSYADNINWYNLQYRAGFLSVNNRKVGVITNNVPLVSAAATLGIRRMDIGGNNEVKIRIRKIDNNVKIYVNTTGADTAFVLRWNITDVVFNDAGDPPTKKIGFSGTQSTGSAATNVGWKNGGGILQYTGRTRLPYFQVRDLSTLIESNFPTGTTSPVGAIVPKFIGQQYTVTSAPRKVFVAFGATSSDWVQTFTE